MNALFKSAKGMLKGALHSRGYRLGRKRTYEPIQPDEMGRLLSETTLLLFGISAAGDRLEVFDARTVERLLDLDEAEDARRAAERAASR